MRICTTCNTEYGISDSDDYLDEVEAVYPVSNDPFEVIAGVALPYE